MKENEKLKSIAKTFGHEQILNYSVVSGDKNPIHLDETFAKNTDFKGRIAHGMLVLSLISEMMYENFSEDWLSTGKLKVKFRAPLFLDRKVVCEGEIEKIEHKNEGSLLNCKVMCIDELDVLLISGSTELIIKRKKNENCS